MTCLLHNTQRALLRRVQARPLPRNPHRRKTSASVEPKSKQNEPLMPLEIQKPSKVVDAQAKSTKLPLSQRLGPLTKAVNAYDNAQKRRPWATQLGASLFVYFCGDMLAQYIDGESYDPSRTLRHLTIGAGAAIPGYTWYGQSNRLDSSREADQPNHRFMWLNRHFNYPSFLLSLGTKIVVNQLVFATTFNTYFFSMQSLLSGASVWEAWERVKNTVPRSFIDSWKLWPAVTAFSFTFITAQYRFLFAGESAFNDKWEGCATLC